VIAGATSPTPLRSSDHDGVTVFRYRAGGRAMSALGRLDRLGLSWTKNRLENAWSMHFALKELLRSEQYDVVEMPECGGEGLLINHFSSQRTVVRFHSPAELIMPTYDSGKADHFACSLVERLAI